jgi:hypothetical protein
MGWYPDPAGTGLEKWWDGSAWTEFTHKPARAGLFGPDYARRFWPGANRFAALGILFGRIGAGLFVLAIVLVFIVAATGSANGFLSLVALVGLVLLPVCELLAIVFGAIAIHRSKRLGGQALAIQTVVAAGVLLLVSAGIMVVAIAGLVAPGTVDFH